jgi:WD40 repeat protein
LTVFSVNGILNARVEGVTRITNLLLNKEGTIVATGDELGNITLRNVDTLEIIKSYEGNPSSVTTLSIVSDDRERFVVAGYQSGSIALFDIPML